MVYTLKDRRGVYRPRPKENSVGLVINADGEIETVEPWNGHDYSLEQLKFYIGGGYIEIVYIRDLIMVVDDNGIQKELPLNWLASAIYQAGGGRSFIYGTVLICQRGEIE